MFDRTSHSFEKESDTQITIDQAYQEALKLTKKDRIKISDFRDLYGDANIDADTEYVKVMEEKFRKEPQNIEAMKLGVILECVIHENAELSEWLGPNTSTIKPSRYDDIKNGIDTIAEIRESDESASYLALAIDVSLSSDASKKFNKIKEEIQKGELAKVQYFVSEHTHIRGEKKNIPRIVIGADARTIKELAELWLGKDNKALGKHQIQFQIIEEILLQLSTFKEYAESIGKNEIARIYERTEIIVKEILREKEETLEDSGERDHAFEDIKDQLKYFIV